MAERLELTTHRAKVMLSEIQHIYKRGQAQMTAVSYHAHSTSSSLKFCNEKQIYNYIAKNDVKLSHELAAASHKIAAASKRDSTAMKAIALLTMVFLPGTFTAVSPFHPLSSSLNPLEGDSSLKKNDSKRWLLLTVSATTPPLQTLFSMPYFEFSNSGNTLTLKPEFWIYWALTIPLTLVVLAAYLAYLVWIQNKERIEDLAVRKEFNALPQTDGLQDSASRR